jgi:hypothetical protein
MNGKDDKEHTHHTNTRPNDKAVEKRLQILWATVKMSNPTQEPPVEQQQPKA